MGSIIGINDKKVVLDPKLSHIGRFGIPMSMIRLQFDVVQGLLYGMVILEATLDEQMGGVVMYTAVAPHLFDSVKEGKMMPIYDIAERLDGLWEFHRRVES